MYLTPYLTCKKCVTYLGKFISFWNKNIGNRTNFD